MENSSKMGADKSAKNTPKRICPSPKVRDFDEKRLHWASVVRVVGHKVYNLVSKERTENSLSFYQFPCIEQRFKTPHFRQD